MIKAGNLFNWKGILFILNVLLAYTVKLAQSVSVLHIPLVLNTMYSITDDK